MVDASSHRHRYGVAACRRCRHAHAFELAAKTTTCGRCGKRSETRRLQVLYRSDDTEQVRTAVGVVEARLSGGEAALADLRTIEAEVQARANKATRAVPPDTADEGDLVQWAASRAAGEQGTQAKIRRIIMALEEAQGEGFTEAQLEAAFDAAGLPRERALQEIKGGLVRDELYEPRPGRLKRL